MALKLLISNSAFKRPRSNLR